jgi:potassium-transporting ATPase KdpC subunit
MRYLKQAILIFCVFTVVCGLIYPLFITALSQLLFPQKANGSIMTSGNTTVGSALIGQQFDNPRYFHGRPSATEPAYNASGSTGSNFGPTNSYFLEEVRKRIERTRKENGLSPDTPIPADFVLTSASGLDPHVSVDSAMLQVKRIAKERGVPEAEVEAMVRWHIEQPFGGIWGEARVNILKLNLALDAQERMRK